jgi:hypothetical protein
MLEVFGILELDVDADVLRQPTRDQPGTLQ